MLPNASYNFFCSSFTLPAPMKLQVIPKVLSDRKDAIRLHFAEAASHKSFQEIIDIGNTVLNNPILLSDMEGNVLAMSIAFVDQDLSAYWRESRDSIRNTVSICCSPATLFAAIV